jgi:SAM-dependent methyltransferase
VLMESAVERWNEILDARAKQMDAAYARLGRTSADFWDRRARGYHSSTQETVGKDPFYLRLRNIVTPQTSILDVGAGTGRLTLALAPQAKHIIAVEPNAAMLGYLRQDASERGLNNISYLQATWQDAPNDLQADIVICSHVLYPIRDIVPFLAKLQAAALHGCYLYMFATHLDALLNDLWRHFHGDERQLPPAYIHVLDVLYEMGIYANVEIVKLSSSLRYHTLDVAVNELLERLILPGDEQTRDELRGLLAGWLVEQDGVLIPPSQQGMVGAIVWWRSGANR